MPGTNFNNDATVTVGTVIPDSNGAAFLRTADTETIWNDYQVENRYEHDKHIYMMGQTSPNTFNGATVGFVQLSNPTLLWIADWTASRWKVQPDIPDSTPTDSNWVLLDKFVEPCIVVINPNGQTPLYRISGTYFYGCRNPSTNVFTNILYARPPWLQDIFPRTIDPSKIVQNLINKVGTNIIRTLTSKNSPGGT